MKQNIFTFKKDRYRKNRGDYSRFLHIYCDSCNKPLFLYQKDGPGQLKRMYIDRILAPEIKYKKGDFKCPYCSKIRGTYFIYEKENRQAIRLYQGSIIKKIGKGVYPF